MENSNFEHKSNDIEMNNDNKTQDADNEGLTYGAVYTPDADGNGYSCSKYNYDIEEPQYIQTTKMKNKTKKRLSVSIGVLVIIIFCILLANILALTAFYFVSRSGYAGDENFTASISHESTDTIKNNVYIDNAPQFSEQTVVSETLSGMEEAIEVVYDSVVEITTESVISGFGGFSQYVVSGAGSGVIVSSGGYIITNHHVIEGASNIIVRLTDGSEHKATLVGTDSKTDVAVIAITPPSGKELPSAVIGNSDSLKLGQTVIAIGNPLGELGGTVTDGIISCLAREIAMDGSGTMTLLQTNAAVSPGNSGGGLFDLNGRLIGVVNAKFSGEGVEGISFAIPVNTAWDVAKQLIDKGYVSGRPALGVTLSQVQYGYDIFGQTYYQIIVTDPQNVNELKTNDIIISVNNEQISTLGELSDIISSYNIGDVVTLTVVRGRKYIDIEVSLVEYKVSDAQVNN